MRTNTAIVVGAGPAGLVAAAHLRRCGLDVTVLEGKARPGGRAASDRVDGFTLNQGPHALYLGGPALKALRALGIAPAGRLPLGGAAPVGVDADGSLTRRAFALPLARLAVRAARTRPADVAGVSAAEWLGEDRVATAFGHVVTYVDDLERLSADAVVGQLRAAARGVSYLHGGWQQLVDALVDAAGPVRLRCGEPVRELARDGSSWIARTDAGEHAAEVVVLAAGGPERAARLLGLPVAAPGPESVAGVLDLGLERLPRRGRRFAAGLDEARYLSVHSPPARLAQRGVLVGVASYGRASREQLESFADAVQPGWRELALMTRHLPAMTTVTAIPTPARGGLAGRPGPEVPGAPGAFLAGDWVGPHGMLLDAAVASAVAAARAAVAHEPSHAPAIWGRPAAAPRPATADARPGAAV